ncbi:hypothetical protein [Neomegalonema perideroedes]|uniref:hypothetical protein n=1 Tax=Neomegalonema perideroedes TaxID=217219 RepID=UPI00035D2842|nr:hypothetical protein [Neomegalonema perideroedes]
MTSSPSLPRFLLALILAPTLIGGFGAAMMASRVPGLDGLGAIIAVSMIVGAPTYFLSGGPLAWRAVNLGDPSRRDAVIWGLLANFASLILAPLLLWIYLTIYGPMQIDPELARRWTETAPQMMESRWQPLIYGLFVFLLGIVFAPLYALAAHGMGRLLRVRPRLSAA